jgi:hypothetical protein
MSENRKYEHKNRNDRNGPNNDRKHDHRNEQVDVEEDDKWNPTPEQFAAYQLRDTVLANSNLKMLLASRAGQTLRDLKDSTLHTSGTIEVQLNDWIKTGYVVEVKGRYSLNPDYQGR